MRPLQGLARELGPSAIPTWPAMKDDAPTPNAVPRKRRDMHDALDRWIAEWLARSNLTVAERERLEAEKARRKLTRGRRPDVVLGVLVDREGMTPAQNKALKDYVAETGATRELSSGDHKAVVRVATILFAAPKHARQPANGEPGVWAAIRYARHRRVPVRVVLPNGKDM